MTSPAEREQIAAQVDRTAAYRAFQRSRLRFSEGGTWGGIYITPGNQIEIGTALGRDGGFIDFQARGEALPTPIPFDEFIPSWILTGAYFYALKEMMPIRHDKINRATLRPSIASMIRRGLAEERTDKDGFVFYHLSDLGRRLKEYVNG